MNRLQVLISYCGADTAVMRELEKAFDAAIADYKKRDIELYICQMEKDCAGTWDEWMVGAVNASNVVVCILSENSMYSSIDKRVLEEVRKVRDNCDKINIVPFKITQKPLAPAFEAHLGRYSAVWTVSDNAADGISPDAYDDVVYKTCLLLDRQLNNAFVKQIDSVNINNGVFLPNPNFVGRVTELEWLRQNLTESNLVILSGEGGIGKTELAKQFVATNPDVFEHGYIVNADGGIKSGVCNIDFDTTRGIKDADERFRENCRLLKNLSEKNIIIFDNCDTEIPLDELAELMRKEMACRFLITSRPGCEQAKCLRVGPMKEDDLRTLVYKVYPDIERDNGKNKEEITDCLKTLFSSIQGHTMTVEMAAAVMRDGDIPIDKINNILLDCAEKCKTARFNASQTVMEHLGKLYDLSTVTAEEEKILKAMCLISPEVGIPRRALKETLMLSSNDAINSLIFKTFLQIDGERTLRLHRLFSDVFFNKEREKISSEDANLVLEYIVSLDFDESDLEKTEYVVALSEFCVTKRNSVFGLSDTLKKLKCDVLTKLCAGHIYLANFPKAVEYGEQALILARNIFGDSSTEVATALKNLGITYSNLGDNDKALEYCLKTLTICEIIYKDYPNHPGLAMSYNNIGTTYSDLGDNDKALEYHRKALAIYEVAYNDYPNHPDLAMSYNNIGSAYLNLGDNNKALEYYHKALAIREIIYKNYPNHPDLAMSYINIGVAYFNLGFNDKALEYYHKALAIREVVYKDYPNHPNLATSYNNIGNSYLDRGDYDKALEYHLKALAICEVAYKDCPNHPASAMSYNNIGNSYYSLGVNDKALEYYLKALAIYEVAYKDYPNHPYLATSYNNIGNSYFNLGDYDKALEYHLKALAIYEVAYKDYPNHPGLADCYNNLAETYQKLGDNENAEKYKQMAETICKNNDNSPQD